MTKNKKTSVDYLAGYVPASYDPNITTSQIKQIPPYSDPSIRYEKYAKRLKGDTYELINQSENSIGIGLGTNLAGLAAGNYSISLSHPEQNFVIQAYSVAYLQAAIRQSINLTDSDGTNGFGIDLATSTGNIFGQTIVPKLFKGTKINISIATNIPVNEFVTIKLFGWYEDK